MNKALGRITGLALGAFIAHATALAQQPTAPGSAESATATDALQEIVVTAQRREESAQHAAIAISTVGAADIAEANVTTPGGLTELVPALQISDQTGPYSTFYVRGVGSFAANALSDSAVAFNFDNVYIGRVSSTSGFFYDLERVEVLKGPQCTLYGRNATGGAINVISHQPDLGRFDIDASAEYGNYSYFRVEGAVNIPIGDVAAARLAVFHVRHNGYLSDGTDDQDDTGGRLSFRVAPSETFNVSIVGDYFKQGGAGPGSTVTGTLSPFAAAPNFSVSDRVGLLSPAGAAFLAAQPDVLNGRTFAPFPDITSLDDRFWGVSATVNWITPIGTVTVIPAYRDSSLSWQSFGPGFYLREIGDDKQTSFEARVASDDHAALRYVVGLFYYDENNHVPDFDVNQQADTSFQAIDTDTVSRAVYGRLTYALTPQVRFTGGVRYTKENKDFSGTLASNVRICVIPFPIGCPNAALYPYNSFTPLPPFFIPGPDGTIQTLNTIDRTGANEESASYSRVTWHAGADWDVTDHNLRSE